MLHATCTSRLPAVIWIGVTAGHSWSEVDTKRPVDLVSCMKGFISTSLNECPASPDLAHIVATRDTDLCLIASLWIKQIMFGCPDPRFSCGGERASHFPPCTDCAALTVAIVMTLDSF